MTLLKAIPVSRAEANDFVARLHRHHVPSVGDKYRIGVVDTAGVLRAVVQVGRPVARGLDDGKTLEVTRLCSDGCKNACSFLYARAARVSELLGYSRIVTYVLESESGTSLRAAGWRFDGLTKGGTWDCKSRPRNQKAPTCPKKRFVKEFAGNAD